MDIKTHFIRMADYNQRMNGQIYKACAKLTADQLRRDCGAFFRSPLGILNHILVGDLLWLSRFSLHAQGYTSLIALKALPSPVALDELLYEDFTSLIAARERVDTAIKQWLVSEVGDDDFNRTLRYRNSRGQVSEREFAGLVSHLFNHQTHHRGQLSTVLFQYHIDVGVTDLLIDIPDLQEAAHQQNSPD
ncbi:DinB family protein [Amphritea sp.]|uniref:DinB family protein n=1 Tax=Amphritea sp. TaxID=1872502 RepID=UPI003A90BDBE